MVASERSTRDGTVHHNPLTAHRSPLTSLVLLAQSARRLRQPLHARHPRPRGLHRGRPLRVARPARAHAAASSRSPAARAAGCRRSSRRRSGAARERAAAASTTSSTDASPSSAGTTGSPRSARWSAAHPTLARALGVPWVVTNDVHYARRAAASCTTCWRRLRHQRTLDDMGTRLRPNGEWYLKSAAQIAPRWRRRARACAPRSPSPSGAPSGWSSCSRRSPSSPSRPASGRREYLARLVVQGCARTLGRAGGTAQRGAEAHHTQLPTSSASSARLGSPATSSSCGTSSASRGERDPLPGTRLRRQFRGLLLPRHHRGRSVKMNLLFERFLSEERQRAARHRPRLRPSRARAGAPVRLRAYGREHAAMVCEQITYRGRSAVRDAARVLGFSVRAGRRACAFSDRFSAKADGRCAARAGGGRRLYARTIRHARKYGGNEGDDDLAFAEPQHPSDAAMPRSGHRRIPSSAADPGTERKARRPIAAKRAPGGRPRMRSRITPSAAIPRRRSSGPPARRTVLTGRTRSRTTRAYTPSPTSSRGCTRAPRHRSIHVGGFVLTASRCPRVVPIEPASMPGRTVIQWEQDDLDPVGLVKIDLLGLGMLTVLQDCLKYIRATRGVTSTSAQLDMTDQAVYDDLCAADTIGVFQVESRAQMNTLPRLKPRASTISSWRSRSSGPARSRARWCIPTCAAGQERRR